MFKFLKIFLVFLCLTFAFSSSSLVFAAVPTVTSVTPDTGSTVGGTAVTIAGTDFDNYLYRRAITVTNNNDGTLTNYQVQVTMETASLVSAGKMSSSGNDIRFYDSDGTTELKFWIEPETMNSARTSIWVKIPSLTTGSYTIYVTYGNSALASASSGEATFISFDDFSSRDPSKWYYDQGPWGPYSYAAASYEVSGGNLNIWSTSAGTFQQISKEGSVSASDNIAMRARIKTTGASSNYFDPLYFTSGPDNSDYVVIYQAPNSYDMHLTYLSDGGGGGSGDTNLGTITVNTWFKAEIRKITATSFEASVYTTASDTLLGTSMINNDGFSDENWLNFLFTNKGSDQSGYFDWYFLRSTTTLEPTVSVGAETAGSVKFDTTSATSVGLSGGNSITCKTPVHAAGAVNVSVSNLAGEIGTLESGYTYSSSTLGVSLTAPDGGQSWPQGTWQNITWSTSGTPTSINLYYSSDGGSTYTSLAEGETDDGTYPWFILKTPSATAKIKIEAVKDTDIVTDESNANFTVASATDYYVNAATGSNDYNGFTSEVQGTNGPWKTLTYASTMAASGTTVHVAAGTYNAALGEIFPITVPASVHVLASTTLATIERTDSDPDGYVIQMGANSTLEGFTINDGEYYDSTLYIAASNAQIINNVINVTHQYSSAITFGGTLSDILISGNTITAENYQGRGIYNTATVTNMIISNNTIQTKYRAISGGEGSGGSFVNVTITQNTIITSSEGGCTGLIFNPGSSGTATVSSNEVRDNNFNTSYGTDGIYLWGGNTTVNIFNNTLINCTTGVTGSGTINITNNIFCGATTLGSHVAGLSGIVVNNATVASTNNNFYDITTVYSGDTITASNDTTYYPRFVNGSIHDYRLFADSPCATAGVGGTYQGKFPAIGSSSSLTNESWVDAVSGDDGNSGAIDDPWQTITHALQNTVNTINVNPGTYNSVLGESFPLVPNGIRLQKVGSGIATIDATGVAQNTLVPGGNSTVEGFTIKGSNTSYCLLQVDSANVQILNNTVEATGDSGVTIYFSLGTAADNCLINNNTITSGRGYVISSLQSVDYPDNLTITNNTITASNSSGYAIFFPPENSRVGNNFTCTGNTITTGCYGIYSSGYLNNATISSNKIIGPGANGVMGIYTNASSGINSITSNEVRGFQNTSGTGYGAAIYINTGTYTIDHNTLVNNRYGLYADAGTVTIKNSIICGAPSLGKSLGIGETGIVEAGATTTSQYNTLFNLTAYSGTVASKSQDLTSYPRFAAPLTHDYRLSSDSPCKNTADDGGNRGAYGSVEAASGITTESWVDAVNGSNDNNGSFDTPFKTITYALATTEQTVHVKNGTYNTVLGENFPFTPSGGQYLQSVASPTTLATIDSTGQGARTVDLTANTTIEGFTIKSDYGGSVLYVFGLAHVLTNTITNSASSAYGVNLTSAADRSQIIGNNIWVGNSSTYGISEASGADNLLIRSNTIEAGTSGYGIYINYYTNAASIESNFITAKYRGIYLQYYGNNHVISNNIIRSNGGTEGIYNYAVYTTTIYSNEVVGFTTNGMYLYSATLSNVYNNTLVNNTGIGIYNVAGKTDLWNNIIACTAEAGTTGLSVAGGDVTYSYSDINNYTTAVSGGTAGDGNITSNPLFVNPGAIDYRLSGGSPCISTGTPEGSYMGCYPATAGTITLRTPNGGETWTGMTNNNITWESTGTFSGVNIYYSIDSGATYTIIATNESNDGVYSWAIPALQTTEAKVKITGLPGETISSESAAVFTITTPNAPTVSSMEPSVGNNNGTLTGVIVHGADFVSEATVKLTRSGQSDITCTVTEVTSTTITCNLPLTGAATGVWNVVVNNPDTQTGTKAGGFTVNYPAPTVTQVSPASGAVAGNTLVTIEGTSFRLPSYERAIVINNAGSELTNYQVLVTLETASLVTAGKMKSDCGDIRFYASDKSTAVPYWIESGANSAQTNVWVKVPTVAAGDNTIYLDYGDLTLASGSDGTSTFLFFDDFSGALDPAKWPTTTGSPSTAGGKLSLPAGSGVMSSYLIPNDTIWLSLSDRGSVSQQGSVMRAATDSASGFKTDCNVNVVDMLLWSDGNWWAEWNNGEALAGAVTDGFKKYMITYHPGGADTALYNYDNGNSTYTRNGDVTNNVYPIFYAGGDTAAQLDYYLIRKYAATEPTFTVSDETSTLLQAYFAADAATSVTYLSSTEINARTPAHAAGAVNVTVINADSQAGTKESAYTYNAVPSIESVSPSSGVNTSEVAVTINGSNFQTSGTTNVKLTKSGTADITATGVLVINPSSISGSFDLTGATTGVWTLVVTEPDSQTANSSFTVNYPQPTVTAVSPASGPIAGGTLVTIEGTGFRLNSYRRQITISNSGSELTNYQVQATLETASLVSAGKMKADCGDIRFYGSDGTTALPYWLESGANSELTKLWVKVPTLEAGDNTVYLTYGDLTLANGSDGTSTFNFFDDFSGASLDTDKWNLNAVNTITSTMNDGHLRVTGASDAWIYNSDTGSQHQAKSISTVDNIVIDWKSYAVDSGDMGEVGIALVSSDNNVCAYLNHGDWTGGSSGPNRDWAWGASHATEAGLLPETCDFRIMRSGDTAKFYIDNTLKATQTISGTPAKLAITVGKYPSYDFRISEIDDLRVRAYAETEPTTTVSNETILASVLFGADAATDLVYLSSTNLQATTPAHAAGAVAVEVTNYDGQVGTAESAYTYVGSLSVTLDTPNGGEDWIEGETYNVTWETSGSPDSINLYYSIDSGTTYTEIITNEADDGSYAWLVPNETTSEAKVRIEAVKDATIVTDESNAVFTIEASILSITLRTADDLNDFTTWEVGAYKSLNTVYIMGTNECVLVKNEGNVAVDLGISGEATNWTLSPTAEVAQDVCALMGLFNSTFEATAEAYVPDNDVITGSFVWATSNSGNGKYEGEESGANVSNGVGRRFYIYLKTPIAITSGNQEQFTINIGCRRH